MHFVCKHATRSPSREHGPSQLPGIFYDHRPQPAGRVLYYMSPIGSKGHSRLSVSILHRRSNHPSQRKALSPLGAFGFLPSQQLFLFVFGYPALFEVLHLSPSATISTTDIMMHSPYLSERRAATGRSFPLPPPMQRAAVRS